MQSPSQGRRDDAKFVDAVPDEAAKQRFSMRRDVYDDVTPVPLGAFTPEKPSLFHAVHQLDRAVMLDLQPLGQTADRRFLIGRQAAQRQQAHVLLRLKPNGTCRLFAVIEIPPDEKTELGEGAIFNSAGGAIHPLHYIVQRRLYRIAIMSCAYK